MKNWIYEPQTHADPKSPLILHYDRVGTGGCYMPNLHEGIEILRFDRGEAQVHVGEGAFYVQPGDMAVINSGELHNVAAVSQEAFYDCLIIDKDYCGFFDIYIDKIPYLNLVRDPAATALFERVKQETEQKDAYGQAAAKAAAVLLLTYLSRHHVLEPSALKSRPQNQKAEIVKLTIKYLQKNYSRPIRMERLADALGFSKYYLCHVFKEVTGFTIINYLNFLRCKHAQSLLAAGGCNVGEAARLCGFENLSYFTKTYKAQIGVMPSEQRKYR